MRSKFLPALIFATLCIFSSIAFADLKGKTLGTGDAIAHTPAGGIAAVTIGGAIDELDTEKAPKASPTLTGTITLTGDTTPTGRVNLPIGMVSYFNTTGTAVVIASSSDGATNLVATPVTTAGTFDTGFDNGGANDGTLRYTGATTKYAHITATLSGVPATATEVFAVGIAKNGTLISGCEIVSNFDGTQTATLHCIASLAQNDEVSVLVGNLTAGHNLTINALNIQALML